MLSTKELKQALTTIKPWTDNRKDIVAYRSVLVNPGEKETIFAVTNMDVRATATIPGTVSLDGPALVEFRELEKAVKTLSSQELDLWTHEAEFMVTDGNETQLTVPAHDPADCPYPQGFEQCSDVRAMTLAQEEFQALAAQVAKVACPKDSQRPVLEAVQLKGEGEKTMAMATDRYRLHMLELKHSLDAEALVPAKMLRDVAPKVVKSVPEVRMCFHIPEGATEASPIELMFERGNVQVYLQSRCVEGQYPDPQSAFPNEWTGTLVVDREWLTDATRQAKAFAPKGAPMCLEVTDSRIEVAVHPQGNGDAGLHRARSLEDEEAGIMLLPEEMKPYAVKLSPEFVLDYLEQAQAEYLCIEVPDDRKKAVMFHGEDGKVEMLLMPIILD